MAEKTVGIREFAVSDDDEKGGAGDEGEREGRKESVSTYVLRLSVPRSIVSMTALGEV